MDVIRTPDARFENLPDYPFAPHYAHVPTCNNGREAEIRVHYLDEGPSDAAPVLLMHGEPSWSYLYRHMIPPLVAAGHRVIAPDLVGFGRSDKPMKQQDYTYARHVAWMSALVFDILDLTGITFFGQDWGGLIGLRLVAAQPDRYARVVIGNTGLPTGHGPASKAFLAWQKYSQETPGLPGRHHRERRHRQRARPRGRRRLRRAVPRRPVQGGRPHLPHPRAHQPRRPGQRRQRAGVGGAVGVREAVRPRLQRLRPDHEGRRRAVPGEGARRPGPGRTRPSRAAATSSRRTSRRSWRRSSSTPSPRADVTTTATAHPPASPPRSSRCGRCSPGSTTSRPGRPAVVDHSSSMGGPDGGIGAARRIQTGRTTIVETVESWDPPKRLAYRLEGLPRALRRVTNEWRLEPDGDRTQATLTTTVVVGPRPPQRLDRTDRAAAHGEGVGRAARRPGRPRRPPVGGQP